MECKQTRCTTNCAMPQNVQCALCNMIKPLHNQLCNASKCTMCNVQYDQTLAQLNVQCFEIAATLCRDKEIMFKVVQSLTWSNCSYIRGRTIMRASTIPWDQTKPPRLPQTHSVAARALWATLFSLFSSFKGLASYCKAETTFTFHFSIINA